MRPAQRKFGSLLVIKKRGLPSHAVMAFRAARCRTLSELPPVDVLVAILALGRRGLEVHVHQIGLETGGLVAIDARRGTMRAE
jgi:hypothetical protein